VFATQAAAPQFGYQWKEGGVPLIDGGRISGATTDTLHIANVEPADHGRLFTCEILDGCVLDETRAAKLNVVILPTITTQPQALVRVCAGEGVGFSVTVSGGNSVPDYQWYADGVALENGDKYYGVRTKSMWINDADYVDEGVAFTCVVSNECQSVESAAAMLEVATPRIVAEPQDACADIGETIVLTVEAESAATVFYQWRKDGASVGSGPTLTLSNVQRQDAGDYKALVFSVNPTCIAETRAAIVQVGSCPTCLTPGDSDGDGDIDLADMQWFMLCAGQSVLSHPECACANAAADDWMVQDADWSAMSAVVTGPQ
jgi:hypothetical protein